MNEIDETFHWVRDKSTGKVSIGRRFRLDVVVGSRGWLWDVMLSGWHDYECQKDFEELCEVISDIKPIIGTVVRHEIVSDFTPIPQLIRDDGERETWSMQSLD